MPPHTINTSFNFVSQVTMAAQDASLFYVYFAHSACIPCGVCYMASSLLHTYDHVYNFTAACHGLLRRGKGNTTAEAEDVYCAGL